MFRTLLKKNQRSIILWLTAVWLGIGQIHAPVSAQTPASADSIPGTEVTGIKLGIGGLYRLGSWTQAQVEIQSSGAHDSVRLEIELPDGAGVPCTYVVNDVALEAGTSKLVANVKIGRVDCDAKVRILAEEKLLAEADFGPDELASGVLASKFLVVSLGADLGVKEALKSRKQRENQRPVLAEISDVSSLPEDWLGYGGVSLVVLPTSAHSIVSRMNDAQLAAIEQWVRLGGRLIFSAGEDAKVTVAENGILKSLLPGTFDQVRLQRETSGIESFAGNTAVSLDQFPRKGDVNFRLPMAALKNIRGTVELSEGLGEERTPAIIRASHGLGHVVFFAADLDLPPIAKWTDGRRRVLSQLVDMALGEAQRSDQNYQFSSLTQIGFDDITGQLRSALDQFSTSKLVPFSWIAVLIGAYIVLIGPVDYFLLKRLRERFELTWITFPLLVLGASALAFGLTQTWKSKNLAINQVNLIDIDAETGSFRGIAWGHVLSPANSTYDFQLDTSQAILPKLECDGALTCWQGLAGDGFGGMNVQRRASSVLSYQIVETPQANGEPSTAKLQSLPVDIHGTRSLSGLTWGKFAASNVTDLTADFDNQLSGIVHNPLPVPLKNCQLYYGRWLYPLASMAPDAEEELNPYSVPKTIKFILTKSRVDEDTKDLSEPWDRQSFDTTRIMQIMMFHKSVGGATYTSLLHRFQHEVDFTDHLSQERAVLVGTVDESAMSLADAGSLEGADINAQSFVRIVLPVKRNARATRVSSTVSK